MRSLAVIALRLCRRLFFTRSERLAPSILGDSWFKAVRPEQIALFAAAQGPLVPDGRDKYRRYQACNACTDGLESDSDAMYAQIMQDSHVRPPAAGSFVEFRQPGAKVPTVGFVIQRGSSLFRELHSKHVVLTIDNELEKVASSSILFHSPGVARLDGEAILLARTNTKHEHRLQVVLFAQGMVAQASEFADLARPMMDIAYAQWARHSSMANVTLEQLVDSLQITPSMSETFDKTLTTRVLFLFSLHLHIMARPDQFLVLSSAWKESNIIAHNSSAALCRPQKYFVNSITNFAAVSKLQDSILLHNSEYDNFFSDLLVKQSKPGARTPLEMGFFFHLWEGKNYKFLVDAMKYAMVYPHPMIINLLAQIPSLVGHIESTNKMFSFLVQLKILDRACNPLLSANLVGEPSHQRLLANIMPDLSSVPVPRVHPTTILHDRCYYLRKRFFHKDTVLYGMPSKNGTCELAFSCEKINARKYRLNIHVPDIMAKIPPSDEALRAFSLSTIKNDMLDQPVLPKKLRDQLAFEEQNNNNGEFFSVGKSPLYDSNEQLSEANQTCMTISFTYNTYDANPFSKFDSCSVAFDYLAGLTVMPLTWSVLENCLEHRTAVLPFALFQRGEVTSKLELSDQDNHNVRLMHSFMKTYFVHRNANSAISADCEAQTHYPRARFLVDQVTHLAGSLAANFCAQNNIPIVARCQDVLPSPDDQPFADEVSVVHNNSLLPTFGAKSYEQTLMARDKNGHVSDAASVVARNFLGFEAAEVASDLDLRHLLRGIIGGYVDIVRPLSNFESMVNQFQLLSSIIRGATSRLSHAERVSLVTLLKVQGYNVHGPMSYESLAHEVERILASEAITDAVTRWTTRYKSLQRIGCDLENGEGDSAKQCVFVDSGYWSDDLTARLVPAWCAENEVEVTVICPKDVEVVVGTAILCEPCYVEASLAACYMTYVETV